MSEELTDRENYTRVTKILYPFSGLDKIDAKILLNAAERGTKVHKICEGIAEGLGEHGIDDEVWGFVESFKQWFAKNSDFVEIEKRFYCDEMKITGQVDFILKTDEGLAIADLKTSSKASKTWQIQGLAYAYLARKAGYDIKKIFFIHLNKHGKEPTIYEYFPINEELFFETYRVYKYFYGE
jgi:hypothetical protein